MEFEELKRVQTLFLSNKRYKECLQIVFLEQIFVYFEDVAVPCISESESNSIAHQNKANKVSLFSCCTYSIRY